MTWNHLRIPGRGEAIVYVVLSNHKFYNKKTNYNSARFLLEFGK